MRQHERPSLARRGFISSLAALPLMGSSMASTDPNGSAFAHIPEALKLRYLAWLANEHAACAYELCPPHWTSERFKPQGWHGLRANVPMLWFPDAPDIEAHVTAAPASRRAVAVLKAAGIPSI